MLARTLTPYLDKFLSPDSVSLGMNAPLQFLTNAAGEKTAVVLPIAEYEELIEDLHDLAVVAARKGEPTIPLEEVITELKRDGLLKK